MGLDNLIGDFVMTHADIKIPETGKIYSFNEGNAANWSEWLKNYMSHVKAPEGEGSSPYSARYIGSLVGDFHRTMLYGGIYGYPGDKKNVNGKLRLIYECAPMSFLAEQAGARAPPATAASWTCSPRLCTSAARSSLAPRRRSRSLRSTSSRARAARPPAAPGRHYYLWKKKCAQP